MPNLEGRIHDFIHLGKEHQIWNCWVLFILFFRLTSGVGREKKKVALLVPSAFFTHF